MTKTIGCIGGGQMAEALIKGMLASDSIPADRITIAEPVAARRTHLEKTYGLKTAPSADRLFPASELIILAVKPQVMPQVLESIRPHVASPLIVTIAAGLPLSLYTDLLARPDLPVIRVMPNMPALILESASALCRNRNVSDDDLAYAEALFRSVGTTVVVEEKLMDGVTGLSGSGPAYVFSFLEALIDAGVKVGLGRDVARELAIQTVLGATRMVAESGEHPALLRDRITSPGGTTISGLQVLEETGFNGIVMRMVEAACRRSMELGRG